MFYPSTDSAIFCWDLCKYGLICCLEFKVLALPDSKFGQDTDALNTKYAAMVCGEIYNSALNGGLCGSSGSVQLSSPGTAGQYKVVLVLYVPPNEFGQDG